MLPTPRRLVGNLWGLTRRRPAFLGLESQPASLRCSTVHSSFCFLLHGVPQAVSVTRWIAPFYPQVKGRLLRRFSLLCGLLNDNSSSWAQDRPTGTHVCAARQCTMVVNRNDRGRMHHTGVSRTSRVMLWWGMAGSFQPFHERNDACLLESAFLLPACSSGRGSCQTGSSNNSDRNCSIVTKSSRTLTSDSFAAN